MATATRSKSSTAHVLVVDDESICRDLALEQLRRANYEALAFNDGAAAISYLQEHQPDVVVTDLMMPSVDGLQLLEWIDEHLPGTQVVLLTAHGDVPRAVEAIKGGAFDFLCKPFSGDKLVHVVRHAVEKAALERQMRELRQQLRIHDGVGNILGTSAAMQRVRERVALAAGSDITVLITGETGTGKELVARALHDSSPRCGKPLVTVNCAALPEALIASELFGHERGSFTSAVCERQGRFEAADGGTLHLDEVGDLPLATQGSLLRVLEEKCFQRVGSNRTRQVDVRVVAATKHDLCEAVRAGRFREDLFYRLNVMSIACPPLRQRKGDIPLLVQHFLSPDAERQVAPSSGAQGKHGRSGGGRGAASLSRRAMQALLAHDWPGNVRELENVLARARILAQDREIKLADLEFAMASDEVPTGSLFLRDVERKHLQCVLDRCGWNRSDAARVLGIDRGTLQRKVERYRLTAPLHPPDPAH